MSSSEDTDKLRDDAAWLVDFLKQQAAMHRAEANGEKDNWIRGHATGRASAYAQAADFITKYVLREEASA